jgi:prepilin-type N-terminal cleavage/methylation domain-containing protein
MMTKSKIENRKSKINNRSGFTLVELLLALAISTILLAAVGAAFNASAVNYRENEEIFKTINNARQALFRMTTQLRTADAVDPNAPINECTLITADGEDITYWYKYADNALYLVTESDGQQYLLCNNVTAMTCTKNKVFEDPYWIVKSVQISLTVSSGDMERTIAAAAVIRRNLN